MFGHDYMSAVNIRGIIQLSLGLQILREYIYLHFF